MSAIPTPFRLEHVASVKNVKAAERRIHLLLDECRISSSKEFFSISPMEARAVCDCIAEFEEVDGPPSQFVSLRPELLAARYAPGAQLYTKNLITLMMAATVNNTPLDHILQERVYVVDGFLTTNAAADFLRVKGRTAVRAFRELEGHTRDVVCHTIEGQRLYPVLEFFRYRNGHAAWKFSSVFRPYFFRQ